ELMQLDQLGQLRLRDRAGRLRVFQHGLNVLVLEDRLDLDLGHRLCLVNCLGARSSKRARSQAREPESTPVSIVSPKSTSNRPLRQTVGALGRIWPRCVVRTP